MASGSLLLNIVLLCCIKKNISEFCFYKEIRDLPKKLIKRRRKYQQKRTYRARIILSESELTSLSDADDEINWSRDPIPEACGFLSKVGERRPSGESLSVLPKKSPTSPGLYMQSRKFQLPDITRTERDPAPETVPLQDSSHKHSTEDIPDEF